jgi:hypothetical protein
MGEAAAEEPQLLAAGAVPSLCCSVLYVLLLPASWPSLAVLMLEGAPGPAGQLQVGAWPMLQCLLLASGSPAGSADSWRE